MHNSFKVHIFLNNITIQPNFRFNKTIWLFWRYLKIFHHDCDIIFCTLYKFELPVITVSRPYQSEPCIYNFCILMVNKYFYFNTHIEIYVLYGLRVLSSSEIIFSIIEENAINRMILLVNILKYTLFSSITLKQYPSPYCSWRNCVLV